MSTPSTTFPSRLAPSTPWTVATSITPGATASKRERLVFLTNNFALDALTIAKLYKSRWQVELFFKWIKQNLRIKSFFGTSENAVKTQVWIAISVYVLVAIVKKEHKLDRSLNEILQILSLNLFEKTPLFRAPFR